PGGLHSESAAGVGGERHRGRDHYPDNMLGRFAPAKCMTASGSKLEKTSQWPNMITRMALNRSERGKIASIGQLVDGESRVRGAGSALSRLRLGAHIWRFGRRARVKYLDELNVTPSSWSSPPGAEPKAWMPPDE